MRGIRAFVAFVSLALWAHPSPAVAQVAVSPPVVQSNTDVPYPEGAQGDSAVVLLLEIDPAGNVSSAIVEEGREPFAEQARRAVLQWRFTPAARGAKPVAARIRARVDFHQEAPTPASAAPTPPSSQDEPPRSAPGAPGAPEPPVEITVLGVRREIGETTLSAADVRQMPGAFGDPFRAIEALPSVTPMLSGLPFFYIRGAPPTNNSYLLDGIRVPSLFHVGIGEGVIHPALIDRVDFYPGSAPAEYGRTAGAVIAGQTREPATNGHGEINVRVIDAGALLESPFGNDRGSALVAGRYGYPGPILGAITSTIKLGYWDYQTRVTWKLDARDTLSAFAFGSHDYLGTASIHNGQAGPVTEQLASDFHRLDLRYDHALAAGRVRGAITLGYDSLGSGLSDGDAPAVITVTNLSARARLELTDALSPEVRLRSGADIGIERYRLERAVSADEMQTPIVPSSADPPPTNVTSGAHAELIWRPASDVEIVPGIRFDVFDSSRNNGPGGTRVTTTDPALEPRLATRVTFAHGVAWLSTLGLTHQYPVLRVGAVPAMLLSVPGFPAGDSRLQTTVQETDGIELALPADFTLTTTGFVSASLGLTDVTAQCIQIMPATTPPPTQPLPEIPPPLPYTCPSNDPVNGLNYGAELLLRRPLSKRLSGWLSYTISRSTRSEYFITESGRQVLARVASDFDRTHVLNAVLAYDLGRRWRAGGRLVFYTGVPFSKLSGNVPVAPYNNQRTPSFYRLDFRLEKRWPFAKTGYFAFIAEVQNATLNKEVSPLGTDCMGMMDQNGGTNQCKQASIGPLTLPSVGVEAAF